MESLKDQNTEQFEEIKGMIRDLSKTVTAGFEMMEKAFSLVSKLSFSAKSLEQGFQGIRKNLYKP